MKHFFFNHNAENGKHKVHSESCSCVPTITHRTYIGFLTNYDQALKFATDKHSYKIFGICKHCCTD